MADVGLLDAPAAALAGSAAVAVVDGERRVGWTELESLVRRAAHAFLALGVQRGDAVCWQLPNRVEAVVVHLAALRIGAVSTPVVPIYRHREVAFVLRQSRAVVMVVPDAFRGFAFAAMLADLRPEAPDLHHVVVVGRAPDGMLSFADLVTAAAGPPVAVDRSIDDPAVLLYTSGTTGDPKGVVHTHRTLGHEVAAFGRFFALGAGDVVLMPSPLTHITGLAYGIHLPAALGSAVVLQAVWNPDEAWRLIRAHGCRVLVGATPFLHGLLEAAPAPAERPPLTLFACGGADVPAPLVERAGRELRCVVVRGYGSTEQPTATSCNQHDPLERRATTDGRAIETNEIRIVSPDGRPVPPGTAGEVQIRGPELFVGYLDAALDAAAFTADGWFVTGDLGVLDAAGYLTITGRLKDIIIRGGENIAAREIESLIAEHPAVADTAVVGLPDPVLGERVCAFVVLRPHAHLDLPDLLGFLARTRIARQKLPERLDLVDELPRTPSGKVQKHVLRSRLVSAAGGVG